MAERRTPNKVMVAVALGAVALLGFLLFSHRDPAYKPIKQLPSYDKASAPSDGDSQADTIRALQAYAKEAVGKAEALNQRTQTQATAMQETRQQVDQLSQDTAALHATDAQLHQRAQALQTALSDLKAELEALKATQASAEETLDEHGIPIGFGYDHLATKRRAEEGKWYEPLDGQSGFLDIATHPDNAQKPNRSRFDSLLNPPGQAASSTQTSVKDRQVKHKAPPKTRAKTASIVPAFTLPKDTVLYDAVALTALLGRIPVEGTTPDPYPVKIFIGSENMAANGHQLPEVKGMLFSGWGMGDWNLSCVSVRLHSATYIFEDGRIVNHSSDSTPLGYISDRHGWPCVSGTFRSNAPKFLAQRVTLAGLGAAGAAYAEAQFSKQRNGLTGGISSDLTGEIHTLVGGTVVKSATDEVGDWLLARQKHSFDAVVVPPGASVSIHLEQTLAIDHAELGRQVRYSRDDAAVSRTLD